MCSMQIEQEETLPAGVHDLYPTPLLEARQGKNSACCYLNILVHREI